VSWFIVYTRSRQEKKVASLYDYEGIEYFIPSIKERRKWSDRVKIVDRILFTSYVFVKLEKFSYDKIFVQGVVTYLKNPDKTPKIVSDEVITSIKEWILKNQNKDIQIEFFKKGDSVEFDSVFFNNQKGVIQEVKKDVLIIAIEHTGIRLSISKDKVVKVTKKD
jgi:transcriptional antiterminator RfaH